MRTVFFGTPDIAVPALRALARSTEVCAVVCQPDRPRGRGLELQAPAVKQAALELGLPVHQPLRVKTELEQWLAAQRADVAVVMAYGRILPEGVLAAPRLGCVNLHASLLPRYRGAAPIQWALIDGEAETGISLMQVDAGMDTGPVFTRHALVIGPDETADELSLRLAALAAEVVTLDLPHVVAGELRATPQDDALATHARKLEREDTWLDWSEPAARLAGWIRGLSPQPGARALLAAPAAQANEPERELVFFRAEQATDESSTEAPGTVLGVAQRGLLVATGDGVLCVTEARVGNGKRMAARALANGLRLRGGERLHRAAAVPGRGAA